MEFLNHVITLRLRRLIRESPNYSLVELLESSTWDQAAGHRVALDQMSSDKMDALWRKKRQDRLKREAEAEQAEVQEQRDARRAIVELYVDCQSSRDALDKFFPPATVYKLRSRDDVRRWVDFGGDLQLLPQLAAEETRFAPGDRCFILALMENKYGWPDHAGCWMTSCASGGGGSLAWHDMTENNMHAVMQHGRKGARGLFMAECEVKRVYKAARLKLHRIRRELDADPDAPAQPRAGLADGERTYFVRLVNPKGSASDLHSVEAFVHESLVFARAPGGWTREVEIFQGQNVRFKAFLPPEGVLKMGPQRKNR